MSIPELRWSADGTLAVAGSGAELLGALLQEFDARGMAIDYSPGIAESEMNRLAEQHGARLSDEMRVWWGWRNGVRPGARRSAPWSQLSLAQALAVREDVRDPELWHEDWLPIAGDNSSGWSGQLGETQRSAVRYTDTGEFSPSSTERRRGDAESICAVVAVWLTGVERGWVTWNTEREYWTVDRPAVPIELRQAMLL